MINKEIKLHSHHTFFDYGYVHVDAIKSNTTTKINYIWTRRKNTSPSEAACLLMGQQKSSVRSKERKKVIVKNDLLAEKDKDVKKKVLKMSSSAVA